jgi:cytochrome c-type protein NapB
MRAALLLVALLLPLAALAQDDQKLKSLRGAAPIPESNPADAYRMERSDRYIPRNHRWQPPVIPHHIKGYQITTNVNMCMSCHSRKAAQQTGARPVGKSHYVDRDGKELPNISTRRYFCLQCHVPQYNADALVGNSFRGPQ